jgi:hypothetical protein
MFTNIFPDLNIDLTLDRGEPYELWGRENILLFVEVIPRHHKICVRIFHYLLGFIWIKPPHRIFDPKFCKKLHKPFPDLNVELILDIGKPCGIWERENILIVLEVVPRHHKICVRIFHCFLGSIQITLPHSKAFGP